MRLPQHLLANHFFQFSRVEELLAALSGEIDSTEVEEIRELQERNLLALTSIDTLSATFGINPGFARSLVYNRENHYRTFRIPKGTSHRVIQAPKIALKIIQKWISARLTDTWHPNEHVYGFIPGRSHVDAAKLHCTADWIFSVDIENFFPSTPEFFVISSLQNLGYSKNSSELIAALCCYKEGLAQGSPASPILSNICAYDLDKRLIELKEKHNCTYTRYADDIVFSGKESMPEHLETEVLSSFKDTPWKIAKDKTTKSFRPSRLKVHGLLVDKETPRLTKGYRNKIRAYKHILRTGKAPKNESIIRGHIGYSEFIDSYSKHDI